MQQQNERIKCWHYVFNSRANDLKPINLYRGHFCMGPICIGCSCEKAWQRGADTQYTHLMEKVEEVLGLETREFLEGG